MKQRQCIILKGDSDWCQASSHLLLAEFNKNTVICLSNHLDNLYPVISQKQAQKQLGKEFDAVVFDGLDGFNVDSFGAIVGTIKAGGALLVWLPNTLPETAWLRRFEKISTDYSAQYQPIHLIQQGDERPILTVPVATSQQHDIIPTADQQAATKAILHVVQGHRRRPLVLSSDRGRGKSSALGMAAAELITLGKQNIIVTAPSLATVDTVFEHASRLLPAATMTRGHIQLDTAQIRFIAPDALIESDIKADLVLVDEAAAIPAPLLAQLLQQFSRIVFATTLHGYEGTGLGFAIRFKRTLDRVTPNWRSLTMTTPIRWSDNDILEAFSFKTLLLDAEPVADDHIQTCQSDACVFEKIDRIQLATDEISLGELFGLMVLAHYRTRPSDLQMLLDRDDVSVYVMRYQGHIVASAWLVKEGELDDSLSHAIHGGTRRLKGHLLPQSLLAHVGIATAGSLNYQRIIRIAVHPAIQQRGIGQALLTSIVEHVKKTDCDIIGTSFGVSVDLLKFWSTSQFVPVRLGIQQDDVSGSHAVMMLQALTQQGHDISTAAQQRFQQQWPALLAHEFNHLAPELVIALSADMMIPTPVISIWDLQEIQAFCHQQRAYESSRIALNLWFNSQLTQPKFAQLTRTQQYLSIMSIMQQGDWSEIAKRLGFSGKTQSINALRQVVAFAGEW